MSSTGIKQVNSKLKQLPETRLEEVEHYIDFLTFKYNQEEQNIPQWHKDIVLKRVKNAQEIEISCSLSTCSMNLGQFLCCQI